MSITVRDCLNLPSLSMGKVIAGHKGLDHMVTTVSVIEFDDDTDDFFVPNEIVITSFYNVKNNIDEQCRIIKHSKASGDVAMILFYSDIILDGIDEKLIKTANALDFPLIVLKGNDMGLKYSDVIKEVMEAVILENNSCNYFVNNSIEQLSLLKASDRTMSRVLSTASAYFKLSLFLCDMENNLIAKSFWPPNNKKSFDIFNRLISGENIEKGVTQTPIKLNGTNKMTLYALSQTNFQDWKKLNRIVELISISSTLWNLPIDMSRKDSLIPILLEGDGEKIDCCINKTTLPIEKMNNIILAQWKKYQSCIDKKRNLISSCQLLFKDTDLNYVSHIYNDHFVLIFDTPSNREDSDYLFSHIKKFLAGNVCLRNPAVFENISNIYFSADIFKSYCKNIDSAKKIFPNKEIMSKHEITFALKCNEILEQKNEAEKNFFFELIAPLRKDTDNALAETLCIHMLDGDSEVKRTAKIMFLHRNTVLYRLNKIKALLGYDINSMPAKLHIYTAAALERLK